MAFPGKLTMEYMILLSLISASKLGAASTIMVQSAHDSVVKVECTLVMPWATESVPISSVT